MKTKIVPTSALRETAICLGWPIQGIPHAYKEGKNYVIFAGNADFKQSKTKINVWAEKPHEFDMIAFSIVNSYGQDIKKVYYQKSILHMIGTLGREIMKLGEVATILHQSEAWVSSILRLREDINKKSVCLANAYFLSKIKEKYIPVDVTNDALNMHPRDFGPRVFSYIKLKREL